MTQANVTAVRAFFDVDRAMPDLTKALREAPPAVQRQVFQAFEVEVLYDKAERRIEISATVSEAIASAFENKKALRRRAHLWY